MSIGGSEQSTDGCFCRHYAAFEGKATASRKKHKKIQIPAQSQWRMSSRTCPLTCPYSLSEHLAFSISDWSQKSVKCKCGLATAAIHSTATFGQHYSPRLSLKVSSPQCLYIDMCTHGRTCVHTHSYVYTREYIRREYGHVYRHVYRYQPCQDLNS